MTRRFLIAFIASMAILSGCTAGSVDNDPPKGSNASTDEEKKAAEEPEPAPDPKFGQTFTYDDQLSVNVSVPKDFKPGQDAYIEKEWPRFVQFEVTIVNGTKKKIDPSGIYLSLQSNDVEAEEVFDTGFEGPPSTTLLAGRQARYKVAFGVDNPDDLVMDFTLNDFEREDITFVK